MIDVTGIDKVELVKKAYELSRPQGLGMMHFTSEPLSDEEAKSFIEKDGTINMDYVKGRACKFNLFVKDGVESLRDEWFDHTDGDYDKLLAHFGISRSGSQEEAEHVPSCNCDDCRIKRGKGKLDPQKDFEKAVQAHKDGTAFQIQTIKPTSRDHGKFD